MLTRVLTLLIFNFCIYICDEMLTADLLPALVRSTQRYNKVVTTFPTNENLTGNRLTAGLIRLTRVLIRLNRVLISKTEVHQ